MQNVWGKQGLLWKRGNGECVGLEGLACGVEQAEISQGKEEIPTKMGPQPITKIPDAYKSNF